MEIGNIEKIGSVATAVALASCSSMPIQNPEVIQEVKEPVSLSEPSEEAKKMGNVEQREQFFDEEGFCIPIEINPSTLVHKDFSYDNYQDKVLQEESMFVVFDQEVLDIWKWDEMGMETACVQRRDEVVEVVEPTLLYSVDLSKSGLIKKNLAGYFRESRITAGTLDIIERRTIKAEDGSSVVLGVLPYEGEAKNIQAVVLEAIDSERVYKDFVDSCDNNLSVEEYTPVSVSSTKEHQILGEVQDFVDYIYNPEDLTRVWEIVKDDPILNSVFDFKEALDGYEDNSGMLVAEYLRSTEWYQNMVAKVGEETMREVVRIPDLVKIPGQPIQCVLFDKMMTKLYPELNIPDVRTPGTGYAKEIPQFILPPSPEIRTLPMWYGPIEITGSNMPIDTYQAGDVFVTIEGEYGHTGVILGKYVDESGEPFLLVADSNRAWDGRIKVLLVDKYNIGTILGPDRRFIIRSH